MGSLIAGTHCIQGLYLTKYLTNFRTCLPMTKEKPPTWLSITDPDSANAVSLVTMPTSRLPIHRRSTTTPRCYGRYGPERLLRRRRSPVQTRNPHLEIPSRTRYHHQLGRYGKNLAPHLLQRAPSCSRRMPNPSHRSSIEPKS